MRFVVKTPLDRGLKIYGSPVVQNGLAVCVGAPIRSDFLLIRGDWVVNGEWPVSWLGSSKNRGYAGPQHDPKVERTFDYICHVEDVVDGMDYNRILSAYEDSLSGSGQVVQP